MSHEHYDPVSGDTRADPADAGDPDRRPRPGLAWERRDELGPGPAMLQTIRDVVFSPRQAFSMMHTSGGWAEPLGFAALVGSVGIWFAQAWDMFLRTMMAGSGMAGSTLEEVAAANATEMWFALFAPFLVCAATFFGAGIVHLLLMMFGGTPRPFETTFRVFCYTWAVSVFNAVPICGVLIAAVWRVVTQIIGLREAHGVPTGQAAAAVLIPVTLACFCLLAIAMFSVGVASLVPMAAP